MSEDLKPENVLAFRRAIDGMSEDEIAMVFGTNEEQAQRYCERPIVAIRAAAEVLAAGALTDLESTKHLGKLILSLIEVAEHQIRDVR